VQVGGRLPGQVGELVGAGEPRLVDRQQDALALEVAQLRGVVDDDVRQPVRGGRGGQLDRKSVV